VDIKKLRKQQKR